MVPARLADSEKRRGNPGKMKYCMFRSFSERRHFSHAPQGATVANGGKLCKQTRTKTGIKMLTSYRTSPRIANLVSVSGGKDSTATLLLALDIGVANIYPVFADTGNEHEITYEYLDYLEQKTGLKIRRVKSDFTQQIIRKREITLKKWREQGVSEQVIESAEKTLVPTGNPYLDLCLWKGRFPSSSRQYCTEELKIQPITNQAVWPLLKEFDQIESWQGIRWDESPRRSTYVRHEGIEPDATRVYAYRPILSWSAKDVFAYCARLGVEPNPLYRMGMGRVGCMPCINVNKQELKNIVRRFPEVVERIAHWEHCVSLASKQGSATFLCAVNDPLVSPKANITHETHGIRRMADWATTSRGGRQRPMFDESPPKNTCNSIYPICE